MGRRMTQVISTTCVTNARPSPPPSSRCANPITSHRLAGWLRPVHVVLSTSGTAPPSPLPFFSIRRGNRKRAGSGGLSLSFRLLSLFRLFSSYVVFVSSFNAPHHLLHCLFLFLCRACLAPSLQNRNETKHSFSRCTTNAVSVCFSVLCFFPLLSCHAQKQTGRHNPLNTALIMSRPSAASYYSETDPYSPVYSGSDNTRKASVAESTDSTANPVFFHTPPATAGQSRPSPPPGEHIYCAVSAPVEAAGDPRPVNAGLPTTTTSMGSSGRPPRASAASAPSAPAGKQGYEDSFAMRNAQLTASDPYRGPAAAPPGGGAASRSTASAPDPASSAMASSPQQTASPNTTGPTAHDTTISPDEDAAAAEAAAFDNLERRAREALEAIAVRDEDVEVHMNDYVRTLRQYRDACEARTLYREAHLVEQVLRNLKLEEETRHIRGLTEQQTMERQQLEDVHREEFRQFHRAWNAQIDEFEESQLEAEIALLERQNDDLLALHEEMRAYNPRALKCDKHTLDARSRQQLLASQRDYRGASKAKAEGDNLEWNQLERAEEERATTYVRRERTLRQHHLQELNALRMKVESKRLLLEKHRKRELDELLQRYINLRRGMDNQHAIVRSKTGTLLLKHAQNPKSNLSGTAAVVESAASGTFGSLVQRRQQEEYAQSTAAGTERGDATESANVTSRSGNGSALQPDQRRLMDGSRRP